MRIEKKEGLNFSGMYLKYYVGVDDIVVIGLCTIQNYKYCIISKTPILLLCYRYPVEVKTVMLLTL